MNQAVHDRLQKLRGDTNAASLAEVIRRSLAVYELLWAARMKGQTIVVRGPDGERELLLVE